MSFLGMDDLARCGCTTPRMTGLGAPTAPTAPDPTPAEINLDPEARDGAQAAVESIGYPHDEYKARCPQLIANYQFLWARAVAGGYTLQAKHLSIVIHWLKNYWCPPPKPPTPVPGGTYVPLTPEQEAILRGGRADLLWGPVKRAIRVAVSSLFGLGDSGGWTIRDQSGNYVPDPSGGRDTGHVNLFLDPVVPSFRPSPSAVAPELNFGDDPENPPMSLAHVQASFACSGMLREASRCDQQAMANACLLNEPCDESDAVLQQARSALAQQTSALVARSNGLKQAATATMAAATTPPPVAQAPPTLPWWMSSDANPGGTPVFRGPGGANLLPPIAPIGSPVRIPTFSTEQLVPITMGPRGSAPGSPQADLNMMPAWGGNGYAGA